METAMVSIIIPIYNAERYLSEALQSVLNQTYSSWEMICIDDCSSDSSINIIAKYASKDSRIKCIRLSENSGVANARNIGLQMAKGKYVAFLDSDDIWEPEKLKRQIEFMENQQSAFSFTSYRLIDQYGKDLKRKIYVPKEVNYSSLLQGNQIACFTVMFNRLLVDNIKMPNVKHEDYATWLGILKRGYVGNGLDEVLGSYRISKNSLSGNKLKSAMWTWNIYRNVEKLPFHKALLSFGYYIGHGIDKYLVK